MLLLIFATILSLFLFIPGSDSLLNLLMFIALILPPFALYSVFHERNFFDFRLIESKFYQHFVVGFGISTIVIFIVFGLFYYLNIYSVLGFSLKHSGNDLIFSLLYYLILAFGQEIFMRGYIYNLIKSRSTVAGGVIFSSLIFIGIYRFDPILVSDLFLTVTIFLLGVVLVLLYEYTDSLWTSIGFHLAWIFVQDTILAIRTSNVNTEFSIVQVTLGIGKLSQPLYSGVPYDMEGSVITTLCLSILVIILCFLSKRKKDQSFKNIKTTTITWYNDRFNK
ncbi:CPBP family intramembrane glutamic endopeptidase [Carnobacterium gallinarum]|uniref:CPBP family intramembrane glutamic endopeptidase n=1 Tax=Carnobacterium gallinarum TaxID=2749 RepID=UPI0014705814|nr:CPBP family intramembrane glutamic endopeptidase [Carnobacterium gallinarum]